MGKVGKEIKSVVGFFFQILSINASAQDRYPNRLNPGGWGCRIHRLRRCGGVRDECPGYDIKQSDGEAPALEIWGMWSILLLLLLPRSGVVEHLMRVQSMGQ